MIPFKKLTVISMLILVITPALAQVNAEQKPLNHQKVSNIMTTSSMSPVLAIEKVVNKTTVEVNESILVQLIITNYGDAPIYNINLTETKIDNPEIITNNLFSPMLFAKFEPNEQRIISYSIVSLKVANITIGATIASYHLSNSANSLSLTSYSKTVLIIVKAPTISQDQTNLNNLLIVTILATFYTIILVLRIIFKLVRKSKQVNQ